jgi:DNA-binding response OmpR family regulator
MVLIIGNDDGFSQALRIAFEQKGIPSESQRFGKPMDYGGADAFIVHLTEEGAEAFGRRLDFCEQLHYFHPRRPLFALADNPHHTDPHALWGLDWAGLFAPRWGPAVVVESVRRYLLQPHSDLPSNLRMSADGVLSLDGGRSTHLGPQHRRLLAFLMRHRGEIIEREEILRAVWRRAFAFDLRVVDAAVSRLRKKVRTELGVEHLLSTVTGRGYAFPAYPTEGAQAASRTPELAGLVVVGFHEAAWRQIAREADHLGVRARRWALGDAPLPGSQLLLLRADPDSGWLPQLQATLQQHPGSPAIVCDGGATSSDLQRALTLPAVQLCSLERPEETFRAWLHWVRRRFRAQFTSATTHIKLLPYAMAVRLHGIDCRLAPKDYAVLELLLDHAERTVPREHLRLRIWGGNLGRESRSLDVRVSRVRRLLQRHFGAGPPCIDTIKGLGYRLRL